MREFSFGFVGGGGNPPPIEAKDGQGIGGGAPPIKNSGSIGGGTPPTQEVKANGFTDFAA